MFEVPGFIRRENARALASSAGDGCGSVWISDLNCVVLDASNMLDVSALR